MNKQELIKRVSKKTGLSQKKVKVAIDAFIETISSNLAKGESISLLRFGRWCIKDKAARKFYNISSHKIEAIPSKRVVAFSPSRLLLRKKSESSVDTQSSIEVKIKPTSILAKIASPILNINTGRHNDVIRVQSTGNRIERNGRPNFGQRVKRVQTIESCDLKYIGYTDYYQTTLSDCEIDKYPKHLIPFYNTPILEYRTKRYSTGGIMEPVLIKALLELQDIEPAIEILQNISLPILNRNYGYKPDIAIIWREKNIFIDIEIDEPYDIVSHRPIHYKSCNDKLRNQYFLDNGWSVIRIAEKQIVDNCDKVVDYIKSCLSLLAQDGRFQLKIDLDEIDRWSFDEAKQWAEEGYRESYLGLEIEKTHQSEDYNSDDEREGGYVGISQFTDVFERPKADIINDRYNDLRTSILDECKFGKYICFSLEGRNYDYITQSDRLDFIQKDGIFGINLFDIIESESKFIAFQEIGTFKHLDSIVKYEVSSNDEWNDALYDAILNAHPLEIEYDTANLGNPRKRVVLYPTFWYNLFDENDNRKKFSIETLLTVAAQFRYETLAEQGNRISYFSGYCTLRSDLRTFNAHRIKSGRILNCRKSLYNLAVNDIWKMLNANHANMAIAMYEQLPDIEKKNLFHFGNYVSAIVMQGNVEEAKRLYLSIPKDSLMPMSKTTWSQACFGDFDHFIEEDNHSEEFKKIKSLMIESGW